MGPRVGVWRFGAGLAAVLMLSGCAHHKVRSIVLPPFTPVELAQLPPDDDPPMIEGDDDADDLPPVPVAEGATTPKRQRRRVVKVTAPPPPVDAAVTQVATGPTEAESASIIGQLTPGGDQDPKAQQEASELIGANERRLSALPAEVVRGQAALVSNVRDFQKKAMQALRSGDAQGAKTLATKGKLLLDDLEKSTAQ